MDVQRFRATLLEGEKSPNTIRSYMAAVDDFRRRCGDEEPTKERMLRYKSCLVAEKSPRTAAARVTAMNAYCKAVGLPGSCVRSVRIFAPTTIGNVITAGELAALVDGLQKDGNVRGYWMVRFLAETGARVSELVRMDKRALQCGAFSIWSKGKIRTILISDVLRKSSEAYFSTVPGRLLFPSLRGGQMTARGCAKDVERWCRRYGVRPEAAHPHSFRHRFALDFMDRSGKDISMLKTLLGHESIETTAVYLRLSEEELRVAFEEAMGGSGLAGGSGADWAQEMIRKG